MYLYYISIGEHKQSLFGLQTTETQINVCMHMLNWV